MPHDGTARTAELVKLTENAYRDVNIAFANEISLVCDSLGIDPWELIGLANRHPRVDILQPGPGVGGHCIAVDPWFIAHSAPERTPLIQAARQVNSGKPLWVAEQVIAACRGIEHPTVACLGLAYKADVGDLRESPAIAVIERLQETCPGRLLVVEPHVDELPSGLSAGGRTELVCLDRALAADVILLLTDHREFRQRRSQVPCRQARHRHARHLARQGGIGSLMRPFHLSKGQVHEVREVTIGTVGSRDDR